MRFTRDHARGWGLLLFTLADIYLADVVVRPRFGWGYAVLTSGALVFVLTGLGATRTAPRRWSATWISVGTLLFVICPQLAGAAAALLVAAGCVGLTRLRVSRGGVVQDLAFLGVLRLLQVGAREALALVTASGHRASGLGTPVAWLLALWGQDAGFHDGSIHIQAMPQLFSIGVTYEKAEAFSILQIVVALLCYDAVTGRNVRVLGRRLLWVALWTPFRLSLLIVFYVFTVHLTSYLGPISNLSVFTSRHVAFLSLLPLGFVMAAWRPRHGQGGPFAIPRWVIGAGLVLPPLALAAALVGPPDAKRRGTVLVDEFHSQWERTDRPLDTEWYGRDSGYNYSALFRYLALCQDVRTQLERLTPEALANVSVLIVKTPTRPFDIDELDAVTRFVRRGGGLFLIGDHTNVFGTSAYLNDLAHRFGFVFRYDSILDVETEFRVLHTTGRPAHHPILKEVHEFFFATSCSIQTFYPAWGESVILGRHLKSQTWSSDKNNFFPQVTNAADMDYGAFIQLVARQVGAGRVAAFSDSTTFSNFDAFLPGRRELFLGIVGWLDSTPAVPWSGSLLGTAGILSAALLFLALLVRDRGDLLLVVVPVQAIVLLALVALGARAVLANAELPEPEDTHMMIAFDAGNSDWELPVRDFTRNRTRSMQLMSQWVLRLGYFYKVCESCAAWSERDIVFLGSPRRDPTAGEVEALRGHLSRGGTVVFLLDSARGAGGWAPELARAGLCVAEEAVLSGTVGGGGVSWTVGGFLPIEGGEPLLRAVGGSVALARGRCGQGSLYVCTLGQEFTDAQMGGTDSTVPSPALRHHFGLVYALVEGVATGDWPAALKRHGPGEEQVGGEDKETAETDQVEQR